MSNIIITGVSTGIGFATVVILAKNKQSCRARSRTVIECGLLYVMKIGLLPQEWMKKVG